MTGGRSKTMREPWEEPGEPKWRMVNGRPMFHIADEIVRDAGEMRLLSEDEQREMDELRARSVAGRARRLKEMQELERQEEAESGDDTDGSS